MPIGNLAKGTKENIRVTMTDRSGTVTDLSGSSPTFDVLDEADVTKVTAGSAAASGLVITVPLDTTVGGVWDNGEYRLFVKYTVGSEVVRKGPFYFTITET
jgi:hypothetical protein